MSTATTNPIKKSALETYHKRFARLRKSLQEGNFNRYSADKKNTLLSTLAKYERRLAHWGIGCVTGAAMLMTAHLLPAQTPLPVGTEFRVNAYTTNAQSDSSIAMDSDGDFVVTWSSYMQDGTPGSIYAQRYDASGNPQGAEFRVNTYTNSSQVAPAVAMHSDGDFVVTWSSLGQDGSSWGIYAQRYNAAGNPQGAEFRVNTYTNSYQHSSDVAMDIDGDFVVTWTSNSQDGSYQGVYAQRYDNTGSPLGVEFRVNSYITLMQRYPSVAMDSEGDFVVTWVSNGQEGGGASDSGIYAQRYNNSGSILGSEFRVNTYTTSFQTLPSVAMDSDGDFVVMWVSSGQDGNDDGIYAQRFDNNGVPQGLEFRVNTYTIGRQTENDIAINSDGDFVATWSSNAQDGSYFGIYAQRYNNTGNPRGLEFRVNTYTINYQSHPSIALDSDSDFIVTWQSGGQDGSSHGIYAQRYTLPPLLPVELLYFTGQAGTSANVLEWATATEKNTAWQIVERSVNGVDEWTEIGRVTGAGNSTTPNYYKISDENPLPQAYYRLIAEDFDGSRQYTDIISLQRPGTELAILQVFPQPAGDEVRLDIYAPVSGIVTISVTDLLGREVLAREYTLDRGNHQLVLDMHGLPTGRYQVVICDGDQRVTKAVVK